MKRNNKERLMDLLKEISQIAKAEKQSYLSICISDQHITVNNKYWELPERKKIHLFSADRGESWTDF